nr:peptide chain release factor N(5)-glutamine methyltransferase [Fluviibacterium aquatile]
MPCEAFVTGTAAHVLSAGRTRLRDAGLPDPATDARRLLAFVMGVPGARLTLHLQDPLTADAVQRFEAAIEARLRRQPVAQIVGGRQFWGRWFNVTPDVLDPRPETETLIAAALEKPALRILDLGTGSGCILLTLLAEWPDATGCALEASPAALAVARSNAEALSLTQRATFQLGDWTRPGWAGALEGPFDLIVSNPPYVTHSEMADLEADVLDWEPHMALSPGGDGLDAYRAIIPALRGLLTPTGRVLLEIGPTQGAQVSDLAAAGGLENVQLLPDLDSRDRVVLAHNFAK